MAQTILMRRGTGSISGGNGTATLFTQSGGLATRVIFNNIAFYTTNTNTSFYLYVYVTPSGSAPYVIGQLQVTASGAQFSAVNDNNNPIGTAAGVGFTNTKTKYTINITSGVTYPATATGESVVQRDCARSSDCTTT